MRPVLSQYCLQSQWNNPLSFLFSTLWCDHLQHALVNLKEISGSLHTFSQSVIWVPLIFWSSEDFFYPWIYFIPKLPNLSGAVISLETSECFKKRQSLKNIEAQTYPVILWSNHPNSKVIEFKQNFQFLLPCFNRNSRHLKIIWQFFWMNSSEEEIICIHTSSCLIRLSQLLMRSNLLCHFERFGKMKGDRTSQLSTN